MSSNQSKMNEIKAIFESISVLEFEAWERLVSIMKLQSLSKLEMLTELGNAFDFEVLIVKGSLRTFVMNEKGKDYTLDFYQSGDFLGPYFSRTFNNTSIVNIQALEESNIVLFETNQFTKLRYSFDSLLRIGNKIAGTELFRKTTKEIEMATLTAKHRYISFQKRYPGLENRIPQSMVASYLGISPVSLSRMRGM